MYTTIPEELEELCSLGSISAVKSPKLTKTLKNCTKTHQHSKHGASEASFICILYMHTKTPEKLKPLLFWFSGRKSGFPKPMGQLNRCGFMFIFLRTTASIL